MHSGGTLVATHVTKLYGPRVILDDVSLTLPPRSRIGVVGPNGAGKSTLLRILAGLEQPDGGSVARTPPSATVGYLPQEPDGREDETLLEYLGRRTGIAAAEARMDALAARLAAEPELAEAHMEALAEFLSLGGEDIKPRARAVCAGVGLEAERLVRPTTALSGGQRARVALAAVLLSRFDVLLLDEPANDLDFEGLELLERFVSTTPASVALVSHDRDFLDRTVQRIVELDEWSHRIHEYAGGWSEFEAERERARWREYATYEGYVAERERLLEQQRRMREWEERGYGQGRKKKKTKDVGGAFERRLGRLGRVEKPYEPWQLQLGLGASQRAGDVVVRLDGAVIERDAFRLGPIDLDVAWRDRIALVGPNGSGKTSVLLAVVGRLPLAAGSRTVGPGVVAGELEQGRESFAGGESLLATFVRVTALSPEAGRTLLAKFGLGAEDVMRPAASLSPGERTRAALASFMARGVNLLVLDEPTNHLDLPAIEELERALAGYDGTVILVTHDRRFLDRFDATRVVDVRDLARTRAWTRSGGSRG